MYRREKNIILEKKGGGQKYNILGKYTPLCLGTVAPL